MNLKEDLKALYREIKPDIVQRLAAFNTIWNNGSEDDLRKELIFCLFTPQSKAEGCWQAVQKLEDNNLLNCKNCQEIAECIRTYTRFHHTKARNLAYLNSDIFEKENFSLLNKLKNFKYNKKMREWLVVTVKGLGYKEASHFLRNIGKGENLAILDRHILRKLVEFNIINSSPASLTKKHYQLIEERMREFAQELEIPLVQLDMLLWYQTTGRIFK